MQHSCMNGSDTVETLTAAKNILNLPWWDHLSSEAEAPEEKKTCTIKVWTFSLLSVSPLRYAGVTDMTHTLTLLGLVSYCSACWIRQATTGMSLSSPLVSMWLNYRELDKSDSQKTIENYGYFRVVCIYVEVLCSCLVLLFSQHEIWSGLWSTT